MNIAQKAEFAFDGTIVALWKSGFDTLEIAKRLSVHEGQIANRLARLRDAGAL